MSRRHYDSRKLAVVTGASSGIGFELAKQFAQNGFDLLIAAEDSDIEEAAVLLRDECDDAVEVIPVQVDLAEQNGVDTLYEEIRGIGRPVDAIAINAGFGVNGPFHETDLEDELRMISLNVTSTVHLAKLVVQDMMDWGHGRILFTTSSASVTPAPHRSVYAATRAFIHSFAQGLREELRDKGITITSDDRFDSDPADVARQGFKALMSGKEQVAALKMPRKLAEPGGAGRRSPPVDSPRA